ncbi:MAG: hypothetical protein AUH42_00370, partial [Gemmatimonadetes bacterium 13_1_40CM_70_11]
MTPAPRRSTLLVGLAVVVALLVGGRWLALETAERAWAASVAGGDVYLRARDLARLVHGLILLLAIAWGTANLSYVYRTIGSVQLPRRLGDLEIVEAVPQRVLLVATVGSGLVYGLLLALGTRDWWLEAVLASRPPHFGVVEPILQRDLGYYVGELPWAVTCQSFALLATATATIVVGLLYVGIGSLRWSGWRPVTSPHARGHLGLLLALLALALVRGAALDPAESVAGLHGSVDPAVVAVRLPGAHVVEALGVMAVLASLAWGLRDTTRALVVAWGALVLGSLAAYVVAPGVARSPPPAVEADRRRVERLAFGADWSEGPPPRGFRNVAAAAAALPVWDADRVAAVARRAHLWSPRAPVAGTALRLRPEDGRAEWVVVPAPGASAPESAGQDSTRGWTELHRGALARAGRPVAATEADSGLALGPVATRDSAFWFGAGFRDFAVAAPDTWPATRDAGIPLVGWWRRTALAWVLQSPELTRAQTDGLVLLWRRDVADRLQRLAPFASFEAPTAVVANEALWWISYGYLAGGAFPLVRTLARPGGDAPVRYLRAGLVGLVDPASGATRLFLAPGADSLAGAWARLFAPLVQPLDSLPSELRRQLPFPRDAFRLAVQLVQRDRSDSTAWRPEPREPYELAAPAPADSDGTPGVWMAQGFATGTPTRLTALLAGTISPTGPRMFLWSPSPPVQLPADLLGSPETAPGVLRLWTADGAFLTEQGLFDEPTTNSAPHRVSQVYLTWREREGEGATPAA